MTAPFSLTAPAVIIMHGAAGTFQVTNSGTKALTVHESLGRENVKALQYPAADHATLTTFSKPWIMVSPASFNLAPGQSEAVRISDHVPAGAQGDHFLSVVWTAQPAHQSAGALHLDGGVATTVEIPEPGVAVRVTSHGLHAAPPGPAAGELSTMFLIIPLLLLVVVAAMAVWWKRHRPA